jgi:uncharacterized protein
MPVIATIKDLEAIYGQPNEASTVKVADRITPQYRVLIDKSPFAESDSRRDEREPRWRRGLRPGLAGTRAAIAVVTRNCRCRKGLASGRHVPQPRRAAQQHAAPFGRNHGAIFGYCRKFKRDELPKDGSL